MNKYFFVLLTSLLYGVCLCSCHGKKEEIPMQEYGGVYKVPCVVNDVPMDFIFDTGASSVCISLTEANFLYRQGTLTDKDFIGISYSQIANGDVVPNASVILRKIEIGDFELQDVDAIITLSSDAPLLLGQSAIQKLGIIEIEGEILRIIEPQKKLMTRDEWDDYFHKHFWMFYILVLAISLVPFVGLIMTKQEGVPAIILALLVFIPLDFLFTDIILDGGNIIIDIIEFISKIFY